MSQNAVPGAIVWHDLTVPDAERLRAFYGAVTGWTPEAVPMGGYNDYCMNAPAEAGKAGDTVAGICHARGVNAKVPPHWLIYIAVADLDASVRRCVELGGSVVDGPRGKPGQRTCVIRDPAGAVAALAGP